jgi:hypothetical protein
MAERSEFFTAVTMKNAGFWEIETLYGFVKTDVSEERIAPAIRVLPSYC